MFRNHHRDRCYTTGFPRVCGDVPGCGITLLIPPGFSPRMRGCSYWGCDQRRRRCVFPAYAGMFRGGRRSGRGSGCFPRVCGDVPLDPKKLRETYPFSPRMRGCSVSPYKSPTPWFVFPAYAGMFLLVRAGRRPPWRFPRVCGDVPKSAILTRGRKPFSPRMRGCS